MQTASEVFGVPFQEVTPDMRRDAKTVNFGIIYGMSDYGLSQSLGCPVYKAREYMNTYFSKYSGVKAYTENSIDFGKQNGYVKTLLNRRRKILELSSSNYMVRKFGERASMNMPLQGTASDIIKLAMVKVDSEIKKRNLKSKLILQIHDELIVDTADGELNEIVTLLKETMENVVKLNVPLEVDVNAGKDYYECK
jgi:DNA polymerase-1